jgi:twitching motility protein PilT
MEQKKPIPLVARLAIQLKMLSPEEVKGALAKSASSGNPRLTEIFFELGLLDRDQLVKLEQVQKDLVDKHRAKKQAAGTTEASQAGAEGRTDPRPDQPAGRSPSEVHAAAEHAATTAVPMTAAEVELVHEAPAPAARKPARPPQTVAAESVRQAKPVATAAPVAKPKPRPAAPVAPVDAADAIPSRSKALADDNRPSLDLSIPDGTSSSRERLESILADGVNRKVSDIHLHAGGALKFRVNGELVASDEDLSPDAIESMVSSALTPEQRLTLGRDGELDFCFDLPGVGRFRVNAYRQQRGLDAVFRAVSATPPSFDELGLPQDLKKYTDYHQGMVLITGPAGCGKSSTLAALVNHINENRNEHILTVEDPIEIIHPSKKCLVNQRHAGHHTSTFSRALRGALREDPDIIVIGELRDLETIRLAMTAAETGHFVLATLHTANAVRTINRMIGAFPSNEQDQVRAMLSESLRAVLSQRLVPTADGRGRVPALELLVINRAIGNLIRDEKTVQIRSSMQTGRAHGMYLLEQSLNDLVAAGKITREIALYLAEEEKLITAGA